MNGQGPFSHSCSFYASGRRGQVTSKDNERHRFRESPGQEANPGVAGRSWVSLGDHLSVLPRGLPRTIDYPVSIAVGAVSCHHQEAGLAVHEIEKCPSPAAFTAPMST